MKQETCQLCKNKIYRDEETGNIFSDASATTPHKETANPIPLYFMMYGVQVHYSENKIASMITDEALRVCRDPFKVQVVRKGDFLLIK